MKRNFQQFYYIENKGSHFPYRVFVIIKPEALEFIFNVYVAEHASMCLTHYHR
jgi:hypothetical protein